MKEGSLVSLTSFRCKRRNQAEGCVSERRWSCLDSGGGRGGHKSPGEKPSPRNCEHHQETPTFDFFVLQLCRQNLIGPIGLFSIFRLRSLILIPSIQSSCRATSIEKPKTLTCAIRFWTKWTRPNAQRFVLKNLTGIPNIPWVLISVSAWHQSPQSQILR